MKYLSDVVMLELDPGKCTGCRRCIEVCPRGVFIIKAKKAVILNKDLCIECGACAGNCEFNAVKVNAGVGCATAVINGIISGGEPTCDCSEDIDTSFCKQPPL